MRPTALALAVSLLPTTVWSEALKIEDLQGLVVEATVANKGTFRLGEKQGPGQITFRWSVKMGPEGMVETTLKREVKSPKGTANLNRSFKGPIGRPDKIGGGHFVWVLKDDALTLLRVLDVGGHATTIKFARGSGGWSCSLETAMAKEIGAGSSRTDAAHGGKVTIVSMKQVSSTCKVTHQ